VKVKYTANGARAIKLKTTHFTFSKPKAESEMHGALVLLLMLHKGEESWVEAICNVVHGLACS